MNNFLIYILKSTLCISLLYLLFRTVLRKESFFSLNRIVLLSIVVSSVVIPLLYLPGAIQSPVQVDLFPVFAPVEVQTVAIPASYPEKSTSIDQLVANDQLPDKSDPKMAISRQQLLQYLYLAGFLITLVMLLRGLFTLFSLFRRAKSVPMDGYRLLVIEKEIAAFSFGRYVILSQKDYDEHHQTLLAHEQAHILLHHFFDLLLLEVVRIFHWFNPVIYWLIRDLKEIHEFQADDYTLTNGIDATQYQLLIIQKGVGRQRFALANSFNHCQIRKRITMMNKQKSSKVSGWKLIMFLPLIALLLMAFGRKIENQPGQDQGIFSVRMVLTQDSVKQWNEEDFLSIKDLSKLYEIRKANKWLEPKTTIRNLNGKIDTIVDPYNRTHTLAGCNIQIDSKSIIWTNQHTKLQSLKELNEYIRTFFDYQYSDESTKQSFVPVEINGLEKMMPQCLLTILSDKNTPVIDYQKMLTTIGNTILEIRRKYSEEIYLTDYSKLNSDQTDKIDAMIPLIARFMYTPKLRNESLGNRNSFYIEVRVEGIVLSPEKKFSVEGYSADDWSGSISSLDEQTSTLGDLRKEVEKFMENNPEGMYSVLVAKGSSEELLNEVKRVLHEEKVSNVGYSTFDPVYAYVEQSPEFPGGKTAFKEWLRLNVKNSDSSHIQTNDRLAHVNFIIESNGKISTVKISSEVIKEINPETEAQVARLLRSVKAMPDWIPGRQNGVPVRVLYGLSVYF